MNVSAVTKGAQYDTITCTDPDVTEGCWNFYVRPSGLGAAAAAGAHRVDDGNSWSGNLILIWMK